MQRHYLHIGDITPILILQSGGEVIFITANMAPQGTLPLPVVQVAAAQQLGAFTKTYKTTLANTIGSIITLTIVGALFLAGVTFLHDTFNMTTVIIMLLFALLFLGSANHKANKFVLLLPLDIYFVLWYYFLTYIKIKFY